MQTGQMFALKIMEKAPLLDRNLHMQARRSAQGLAAVSACSLPLAVANGKR